MSPQAKPTETRTIMPLHVTGSTTLSDLSNWVERKPNIATIRLRRPNGESGPPSGCYRALAELIGKESAIIGEPSESLVEAISSMVDKVEDRFPD